MSSESGTPRVDHLVEALTYKFSFCPPEAVVEMLCRHNNQIAELARQLERELAEAREDAAVLCWVETVAPVTVRTWRQIYGRQDAPIAAQRGGDALNAQRGETTEAKP